MVPNRPPEVTGYGAAVPNMPPEVAGYEVPKRTPEGAFYPNKEPVDVVDLNYPTIDVDYPNCPPEGTLAD